MATAQTFEVTSIYDKYNVLGTCASWNYAQNILLNRAVITVWFLRV
jgi:hypothetical protein